jgi:ankyrin repeat protein
MERRALSSADMDGVSPLHVAAENNHAELIDLLLGEIDIDSRSRSGNTPLLLAAHAGAPAAIRQLVADGADLEVRNSVGDTALIAAIRAGDLKCSELLLVAGANVNTRNDRFESAQSLIKQLGDPHWIELLEKADGGVFGLFGKLVK